MNREFFELYASAIQWLPGAGSHGDHGAQGGSSEVPDSHARPPGIRFIRYGATIDTTLSPRSQPGSQPGDKVAMTIVRKEKKPGRHELVVEKQVTFTENIHFEEFPLLNDSVEILVLVDEAHRSNTRTLHRNLRKALPNTAIWGDVSS